MASSRLLSIAALVLAQGLVFALAGIAVRLQMALFDAFDFSIAFAILAAAEAFVLSSGWFNELTPWGLACCVMVAISTACLVMWSWNAAMDRAWTGRADTGSGVFLASLGTSTAAIGAVGLLRGPGLRQPSWSMGGVSLGSGWTAGGPTLFMLASGMALVAGAMLWARRRSGLALSLLSQNATFARELGVERRGLILPCGIAGGLLCGIIACYSALSGGSRPSEGMPYFLYGTCAALLFPSRTIAGAAGGGLTLGCAFGAVQLFTSPGLARMMIFLLVSILLFSRGSSRTRQAVR